MNKNIVIGILVLIIIAISGYAIWKTATPAPVIQIDGSQSNLNETPQTLSSQVTTTTSSSTASCNPSITVLSPNGGETYIAGQQITITWKSCNVKTQVGVTLLGFAGFNSSGNPNSTSNENFLGGWISGTSGSEVVTIPSTITSGKYIIEISTPPDSNSGAEDFSDNSFTINANQQSSANVFSNATYHFQMTLPQGISLRQDGVSWSSNTPYGVPGIHNLDVGTSCESNISGSASQVTSSISINGIIFQKITGTGGFGGMESNSIDAVYCAPHNGQFYNLIFTDQYDRTNPSTQAPNQSSTYQMFDQEMQNLNFAFTN